MREGKKLPKHPFPWFDLGCTILVVVLIILLIGLSYPSIGGPLKSMEGAKYVSQVRQLGTVMFTYASDHEWKYPAGNASTEVFQELMDGGYLVDGDLFYIEGMPGKTPWQSGKLKPENVCWNVVVPVTDDDPDSLPQIVSTGWDFEFKPGTLPTIADEAQARAILPSDSWFPSKGEASLIIFRKGNSAELIREREIEKNPKRVAERFMPADLDPNKAYRQLKP